MGEETDKTRQQNNLPPNDGADPEMGKAPGGSSKREAPQAAGPHARGSGASSAHRGAGPFDSPESLRSQLEEMERQQADLADRLANAQEEIHRFQAEIQNLHRRREKETEEAGKYAIAKFARDTVAVADNFERAINSVPAEATHDNPVLKGLLDGVTMTEREFLNVLERHGVKRISPQDEPFDPHKHQAVMEQENASVPSGTIIQVFQPGYIIADRVLRPAMVVVARGGPKPVKSDTTTGNFGEEAAQGEAPGSASEGGSPANDTQGFGADPDSGDEGLKNGTNNS